MSDLYSQVRSTKLTLNLKEKKHKKHKKRKRKLETEDSEKDADASYHGGWWLIKEFTEITGNIAIEFGQMCYIESLDNGLFKVASEHSKGEEPSSEEIMTSIRVSDSKIALKSGFDKYLSVDMKTGRVTARSDAIATQEQWTPVFQGGKLALLGSNNCFVGIKANGELICTSEKAGDTEILQLRSCRKKEKRAKTFDDETSMETEVNYIKKFQSFEDRRLRVNQEDKSNVKKAKADGNLHEVLLDRREKMKADRYCK